MDAVFKWLHVELSHVVGFDAEDLVEFVGSFDDADQLAAYVAELMQLPQPTAAMVALGRELVLRKSAAAGDTNSVVQMLQAQAGSGVVVSKKKKHNPNERMSLDDDDDGRKRPAAAGATSGPARGAASTTGADKSTTGPAVAGDGAAAAPVRTMAAAAGARSGGGILTVRQTLGELERLVMPGVAWCECQAARHPLLTNCLSCGKVICEQEGWGPCSFCGNVIGSKKQIKADKKKVESRDRVAAERRAADLRAAIERKERLLAYDRDFMRRSGVIDDQSDYYSQSNIWLSDEERAAIKKAEAAKTAAKEKAEADRHRITFDLAGRRVLLTSQAAAEGAGAVVPVVAAPAAYMKGYSGVYRNATLERAPPTYTPSAVLTGGAAGASSSAGSAAAGSASAAAPRVSRLQHDEYFPLDPRAPNRMPAVASSRSGPAAAPSAAAAARPASDAGVCLSMHQPWASLLVAGIKTVEGRTWPTDHRGVLWIAAASHEPTDEAIASVEASYSATRPELVFPASYPVSALLGCVVVKDCFSQAQYESAFGAGREENSSPFVFVCVDPQRLAMPIAVSGDHKIWPLGRELHELARHALL